MIVLWALTDESMNMHTFGFRPYRTRNLSQSQEWTSSLSQDVTHVIDQNFIFSDGNGFWTLLASFNDACSFLVDPTQSHAPI